MKTRLISLLLCVAMVMNMTLPALAATEPVPQPAPDAAFVDDEMPEDVLPVEEDAEPEEPAPEANGPENRDAQPELPPETAGQEATSGSATPAPETAPQPEEEQPAPETPAPSPDPTEEPDPTAELAPEPTPAPAAEPAAEAEPEEAEVPEETPAPEEAEEVEVLAPLPRLAAFDETQVIASDTLTRAEWLHDLVTIFSLTVDAGNMPDAYFPDVTEDHTYYNDIMAATEYGFVDVEAGDELRPDEPATRAFVASTLAMGLGVQPNKNNSISDIGELSELEQTGAHVAVELGWFSLSGDAFLPQNSVSAAEVETLTQSAQDFLSAAKAEENAGSATFAANVKVFPEETEVSFTADDDPVITLTSEQTVAAGDLFAVYAYGVPNLYKAVSVTEDGAVQTITTARPSDEEINSAVTGMEITGNSEISLDEFEPAEGFEAIHVTNAAQIATIAQTYGLDVKNGSVVATKDFTLSNGLKVNFAAEISHLNLKQNYSLTRQEAYIGVTGDYSVSSTVGLDAIQAALGSSSITIGTVPVFGIGKVTVSLELALDGKMVFTYSGDFEVGMQLRGGNLAVTKRFGKTNFSSDIEANAKLGVKADFSVDVVIAQADVWAATGVQATYKSHTYGNGTPANCSQLNGWWYASVGANGSIGILWWKKTASKTIDIYDQDNSPVRLSYHWEDGVRVYACSRGAEAAEAGVKYFTPSDSRYGSSSYRGATSTGTGSNGQIYTIYETKKDEVNHTATITKYHGNASALSIPRELDGYTVVEIGGSAFKGNLQLRAVVIPDTVRTLGYNAFKDCTNLTTVSLPKDVESTITGNSGPFGGCSALRNVTFAEGTTVIGEGLFASSGLVSITIPDTVTTIDSYAFENCANLAQVKFSSSLTTIKVAAFEDCPQLKELSLPDSLTTIEGFAFSDCTGLTHVDLPPYLKKIEYKAFVDCTNLTTVSLPKDVESTITGNSGPFGRCSALRNVTFAEGTTVIGEGLFASSGLVSITIPDTVTTIDSYAFENCANLAQVKFSSSLTTIKVAAFEDCPQLKELSLPNSLTTIEGFAFKDCTSMTGIKVPDSVVTLGERVFSGCTALESAQLPATLKTVPTKTFQNCKALTEIRLPGTVTRINESAFDGCAALKTVEWSPALERIDTYVIDGKPYSNGDVGVVVEGDKKTFYFYDGSQYDIRYVGTDTGAMDVRVTEYDAEETEIRNVYFNDVALSTGKTYSSDMNSKTLGDVTYTLNESGTEAHAPDLDTYQPQKELRTVTMKSGSMVIKGEMELTAQAYPGEQIEIYAYVPAGHTFEGWRADGGQEVFADKTAYATTITVPDADVMIEAVLKRDGYAVALEPAGGSLPGEGMLVTDAGGKLSALPTPTREGYTFLGWYTAAEGGTQVTEKTVFQEDTRLYAHWKKILALPDGYTVEDGILYGVAAGTKVDTLQGLFGEGESNALHAADKNGTELAGNALVGTGCTLTVQGEPVTVMVSCDVDGNGTVSVPDVIETRKAILQITRLEGVYLQAARVSGSTGSRPNVSDAIAIRKVMLGVA